MSQVYSRVAAIGLAAVLVSGSVGCHTLGQRDRDIGDGERMARYVDPCWPQRYSYAARQSVLAPFAAQVNNGAIIDQTIWNYHFENESDTLTPGGLQKLDSLVTRRPAPDTLLYLQTSLDIQYDPTNPDAFVETQQELNAKRAEAVQRYLSARTASRPMNFEIQVIDPSDPGLPAGMIAGSVRGLPGQYRSTITGFGGAGGGGMGGGLGMGGGMGGGGGIGAGGGGASMP